MSEKKTLSKVERFALQSAREKAIIAQNEFQVIIEEVASAHGIDVKADGQNWQFAPDFSHMIYVPAPKPEEPQIQE